MTRRSGFYALVQYCPDRARAEGVNVGVVILDTEARAVTARIDAVGRGRHLRPRNFDLRRTRAIVDAYVSRLRECWAAEPSLSAVESFVRKEPNAVTMTAPRPCLFLHADAEAASLFDELVTDRDIAVRGHRYVRELRELAGELADAPGVRRVDHVDVPVMEKRLRSEFVYMNGKANVVAGHVFARDTDVARTCSLLATQGLLLSQHAIAVADLEPRQGHLIVVCDFASGEQRDQVVEILAAAQVEALNKSDIGELRKRVETEAHEPATKN